MPTGKGSVKVDSGIWGVDLDEFEVCFLSGDQLELVGVGRGVGGSGVALLNDLLGIGGRPGVEPIVADNSLPEREPVVRGSKRFILQPYWPIVAGQIQRDLVTMIVGCWSSTWRRRRARLFRG